MKCEKICIRVSCLLQILLLLYIVKLLYCYYCCGSLRFASLRFARWTWTWTYLPLVVKLPEFGHFGLGLVLEERVVKSLIVHINLPHLRRNPLPPLLPRAALLLVLLNAPSNLRDSGVLDELWEAERDLLEPSLSLEVLALLGPVLGHCDSVGVGFQVH